ncbi:hypothetical protein BDK51DRAFT_36411 [Blyttiomyces helicus]|uniref:glutamine--fructose-6-phosphate transaminase (isomerizing) n=1 Tax=Blyttiomyces helicus TaxID=388810 RepID=A0A4P9WBD7_9FUNG|nr:hypothetical protein BDK51DRAFT_36411 [Blyttiomyces helicus]|eukprot:RKO89794.1 hypothetical protein BDK51DRAFT_36411 [Blyttiomyces helicus]
MSSLECWGDKEGEVRIFEQVGKGAALPWTSSSHSSIGHTKWATHGQPSLRSAGPHRLYTKSEFIVVHKGGVTNYKELRTILERKGCKAVAKELKGAFAIIMKSGHYPYEVIATCRGSPLLIGVKTARELKVESVDVEVGGTDTVVFLVAEEDGNLLIPTHAKMHRSQFRAFPREDGIPQPIEYFLASELSAIVELTDRVLYLKDDDIGHISEGVVLIRSIETITDMNGPFDHLMQNDLRAYNSTIRRGRRITRPIFEELMEILVSVELTSDFLDHLCPASRNDVCVFVSQSGETADTMLALRSCLERGALCLGFINTIGSSISRETHCSAYIDADTDIQGVVSTQAYTSQYIALDMMALEISADSSGMIERRQQIIDELHKLPGYIQETLALDKDLLTLARDHATCVEGALRFKEVSHIHGEGILAGERPLALIDDCRPLLIMTKDSMTPEMQSALLQAAVRKGTRPVIICNKDDKSISDSFHTIRVPQVVDFLQGLITVIPLQLLSYHLAVLNGVNVDTPR